MKERIPGRRVGVVALAVLFQLAGGCAGAPTATATATADDAAWNARGAQLAAQLQGRLKSRLEAAIAQGGPVAAIGVCRDEAPGIASEVSAASGAVVRRTSLRVRNPDNAPDAWERKGLERFEGLKAGGADLATVEFSEKVVIDGRPARRYLKPIVTMPVCTVCHGPSVAPEILAAISARYPADRATGFAQGDLRGAFSVTWKDPPAAP